MGKTDRAELFRQRRNLIRSRAGDGVILWPGHSHQPRNYAGNAYPFRQNSHFLYYTGVSAPNLTMLSFPEPDRDILFAGTQDIDDIVWTGPRPSIAESAADAGIDIVESPDRLESRLADAAGRGMTVHYLPPYRHASLLHIARLLRMRTAEVAKNASRVLMEEVALQRSAKSEHEIAEIEDALEVTARMKTACMQAARPGIRERELAGLIQGIALSAGRQQAFSPIVTVHGEVLHNQSYDNVLTDGRLLLDDSGAESPMFYASDITRTFPVNGAFTTMQADIYNVVLDAQRGAIAMIRPGVSYGEVHRAACGILAGGLRDIGLMRGDPSDAVEAGAHELFFPHGTGHLLGLDVHDLEDLGDILGYRKQKPEGPFGIEYLRLNRPLEPGFVVTVEPGIYFIPALIERWQGEGKHREFLNYDMMASYLDFGGIRIEDDVLVMSTGARILGPHIPKTIVEVESACAERIPLSGHLPNGQ
ncbi:MAG TPA: aminopeptidase P family protein [Acidobacteriota bacterium]|nr:aminopeptidase P family protein [Acidobacteriota bacterium]